MAHLDPLCRANHEDLSLPEDALLPFFCPRFFCSRLDLLSARRSHSLGVRRCRDRRCRRTRSRHAAAYGPTETAVLSWTEAGDEILLRRRGGSGFGIDAISPSTGTSRVIAEALTFEQAELTPGVSASVGGNLFMHTGWGRGLGHRNAIDQLDLATGDVTRLDELGEDSPLSLVAIPDGEYLYYLYYTLQRVDPNLRRLEVATRTSTGIAAIPAPDFGHPYFSPQADRFVYITGNTGQTNPDAEAHLAHVEAGPVTRMGFTGRALDVVWPGGDPHLVYLRHGSGEPSMLHIQPMEGAGTTLRAALPSIDNRGRRLSYLRNEPSFSSFAIDLDAQRVLYPRYTLDRLYIMAYDLGTGE